MRDFNLWEQRARELSAAGRPEDALKVYLAMGDGDPSLDAGYLGQKIGECYERVGDLHARIARRTHPSPDVTRLSLGGGDDHRASRI